MKEDIEKIEKQKNKDYNEMKKEAANFMKLLTKYEREFSHKISDCSEGLACYVDIKANNGVVTFYFNDCGYVGIEIKENEEEE